MAISSVPPVAEDHGDLANDLVSLVQAEALLAETGHRPTVSTLRRWIAADKITKLRYRGAVYVSFSDLLVAHGRRNPRSAGVPESQALP